MEAFLMFWIIFSLFVVLAILFYFEKTRNILKTVFKAIGSRMAKNWKDDTSGDKVKKGRLHGLAKRVAMFILSIIVAYYFTWALEKFFVFPIFRILFIGFMLFALLFPYRKRKWHKASLAILFCLGSIVAIAYHLECVDFFWFGFRILLCIALTMFFLEEILNVNFYPKSVILINVVVVIIAIGVGFYDLFKPHSYYVTSGPRSAYNIMDKQKEIVSLERIKDQFFPTKEMAELYEAVPEEVSGKKSENLKLINEWTVLYLKNNLPIEYGRVELFSGKIFFVFYFILLNIVYLFVAGPEIAENLIQRMKESSKKQKSSGKEGLTATSYILFDLFGSMIHEILQGRRKK